MEQIEVTEQSTPAPAALKLKRKHAKGADIIDAPVLCLLKTGEAVVGLVKLAYGETRRTAVVDSEGNRIAPRDCAWVDCCEGAREALRNIYPLARPSIFDQLAKDIVSDRARQWGRKNGETYSEARAAAARRNGKLGGRPRRNPEAVAQR